MQVPSIFAKTLRDQRWQIIGLGVTLAAIAATAVYIWPAYEETFQNFVELPPAVQALLGDAEIGTPEGFLSAEFFSWTPVLLIVLAIIQGTGAVAGEESSGTMDLLLAQPVTRQAVVVQKAAATLLALVLVVAIGYVGFLISVPFADIEISLAGLLVAVLNMLPIAVLFYALALWAGTAAPNRAAAAAGLIALATAAYFVYSISNGVDALRGLRYATPFYYYGAGRSLSDGITWWHAGVLLGIAAAFIAFTLWAFQRRDISAGGGDVDVRAALRSLNPLAR